MHKKTKVFLIRSIYKFQTNSINYLPFQHMRINKNYLNGATNSFRHAGTKNIIMSLWQADDETTS